MLDRHQTAADSVLDHVDCAQASALSTPRLIDHIVTTHHASLRRALPVVHKLATKVARMHGHRNPALRYLETAVDELHEVLGDHMDEEEQRLFPALIAYPTTHPTKQLATMAAEHRAVTDLLARIRAATDDFRVPDWACNSHRTLLSMLEQLEREVHTHLQLETAVLMPRFVTGAAAG
jgi:regulator of cell morphogenesis and NO signaling